MTAVGTTVGRARRRGIKPPAEFRNDPVVWAAWLYYADHMTQEEVAAALGTSRATVVNLLQEARDREVVTTAIAPRFFESVAISRALRERFGLGKAVVVPHDDGRSPDYERIGRAGACVLLDMLAPDETLGVAWGRTVLALANALPVRARPGVTVAQIVGSATGTYEFSPELCTSNIAARLSARALNLHAPGIVSSSAVREVFMREPALMEQFAIVRGSTTLLFGITGMHAASVPLRCGYLQAAEAADYASLGAVAMLAGRFLALDGSPVRGDLDRRIIGLDLDEIRDIPERICVAGGADKVVPLHAMLRGGFATTLVTDEATARALLRQTEPATVIALGRRNVPGRGEG